MVVLTQGREKISTASSRAILVDCLTFHIVEKSLPADALTAIRLSGKHDVGYSKTTVPSASQAGLQRRPPCL